MDLDEFRSFVSDSGVDVWTWIDMAISMASADHQIELRNRRDAIVQKLYSPPLISRCETCVKRDDRIGTNARNSKEIREEEEVDHDDDEDEQRKILEIKKLLDDHVQNEQCLIELLQKLLEINTTFKTLKETEIGKHVTKLRKHSSHEVRTLVKVLVRKWKDTVDEWVTQNPPQEEDQTTQSNDAGIHDSLKAHETPPKRKAEKGTELDDEDHQKFQHAKKQRRAQVMDIPKMKNSIVPNNGGSVPIKYW